MSGELTRPTPAGAETTPPADAQSAEGAPVERFVFTPPIDIYETDEGLILHADLPGVTLDTLELQVQNNRLTLFGRVPDVVPEGARLVHQEYREGDYLRSFILSDNVDHDRISAKLTGGVLEVFLPHAQKAEPRKIQVSGS
jgi:HSP20 family protein